MSNSHNGQHLSASARKILHLERELEKYELMKLEYMTLLHYLIAQGGGSFDVVRKKLVELKETGALLKGVQSVITKREADGESVMRYTAIDSAGPEKSLIILP